LDRRFAVIVAPRRATPRRVVENDNGASPETIRTTGIKDDATIFGRYLVVRFLGDPAI
jgi:hypothetical protein